MAITRARAGLRTLRTPHLLAAAPVVAAALAALLLSPGVAGVTPAGAAPQTETFDAPGVHTFTVPAGVTEITVEAWGAGGGGGNTVDLGLLGILGGGGGGGGAYARSIIAVSEGETYNVIVGEGGGPAADGDDSSVTGPGGDVTAAGGVAGADDVGGTGGAAADSTGDVTWSGGDGGDGNGVLGLLASGGGGGGSALSTATGGDGDDAPGALSPGQGGAGTGDGGDGGLLDLVGLLDLDAEDGLAPGGGGGGSGVLAVLGGGTGADGRVIIHYDTPDPDAAESTVEASPTTVPANGVASSTVTVTVRSAGGLLLDGVDVSLNQTGSSDINPATVTTGPAGTAAFTVTSATVEDVTYTATAGGVTITDTAVVSFVAPGPDAGNSSVMAVPTTVLANGTDSTTITVTVRDQNNVPVQGATVALDDGGADAAIAPPTDTTDSSGVATFTATNTTAEDVTFTATADGVVLSDTAVVQFTADTSDIPDPGSSTVEATPASVPANGVATSAVTVTVRSDANDPLDGVTVTLDQGAGSSMIVPGSATTDASGVATFNVSSVTAETVTYTAFAGGVNVGSDEVAFTAQAPDAGTSTVSASPSTVIANGVSSSTVTVTVLDADSVPVAGIPVLLDDGGAGSAITPASGMTDGDGEATFAVASGTPGAVTYTATAGGVTVTDTAEVTFIAQTVNTADSTVEAVPEILFANGTATTTIMVTVVDDDGQPIQGVTVALDQGAGSSDITIVSDVTDAAGEATFTATNDTVEQVTYSATADGVPLADAELVHFVTDPLVIPDADESSVTASPASVPADGATASTVTVTVRNSTGGTISGVNVALQQDAAASSVISPASGLSDPSGEVTFTVTYTVEESVEYTAIAGGVAVAQTATVTFTAPPGVPDADQSELHAPDPTTLPADGVSTSELRVTVRDGLGDPVSGLIAGDFVFDGEQDATIGGFSEVDGGVYTFTVSNTTAETVTVGVTADGVDLGDFAPITFTAVSPGVVDPAASSVTASPTSLAAGSASTVTVVLVDVDADPVSGLMDADFTISSPGGTAGTVSETGTAGTYTFTVTRSSAGSVTVTVDVGGVILDDEPTITFTSGGGGPGPSTPPPVLSGPSDPETPDRVTDTGVTVDLACAALEPVAPDGSVDVATTEQCVDRLRVTAPAGTLADDFVLVGVVGDRDELVRQAPESCGATLLRGFVAQLRSEDGEVFTDDFDGEATVRVTVAPSTLPAGATSSDTVLAYWTGERWAVMDAVGSSGTDGSISFTAPVEHFTIFAVFHFSGSGRFSPTPAPTGETLALWGGGPVDVLPSATSFWVTREGMLIGYIPGAPAFVNAGFMGVFPTGWIDACQPMVVVRR